MRVNTEVCVPSSCNLECLEACQSVYGDDSPLRSPEGQDYPTIDLDTCTVCLACVRACPNGALELVEVKVDKIKQVVYHRQGAE